MRHRDRRLWEQRQRQARKKPEADVLAPSMVEEYLRSEPQELDELPTDEPPLDDFILREEARAEFAAKLTSREREVFKLILMGAKGTEIAKILGRAEGTVYKLTSNIKEKLRAFLRGA